jgi:hypothetical protein
VIASCRNDSAFRKGVITEIFGRIHLRTRFGFTHSVNREIERGANKRPPYG